MSGKRYTVTLYIAEPGSPMRYHDGKTDTSSVGHVFYSVRELGGEEQGYGFAPMVSSPLWKGYVNRNEQDIYQNIAYKRTIEISKEQYDKLKAFGEASRKGDSAAIKQMTQGGFSLDWYRAADNSCVDYVFHALRYSGIYNHQALRIESTGRLNEYGETVYEPRVGNDDGRINVLNNAEIFNKIPIAPRYRIKKEDGGLNELYDDSKRALQKAPWYLKVENESIAPYERTVQTASASGFDMLAQTDELLARLRAGDTQALDDFTALPEIRQSYLNSLSAAETALQRNPWLGEEMLPNHIRRLGMADMPEQAQKLYRESRELLADYYQEHNIRYREKELDSTALALAQAGYEQKMKGVSMLGIRDDQIHIGHRSPDLRVASVDARQAVNADMQESIAQMQQTEQDFAREERQRELERMAQSHSRGISMS